MRDRRLLFERTLEFDAYPVLLDPNYPTASNDPISLRHEMEAVGNIRGVGNIKGRTVVGYIRDTATRARSRCRNVGHFVDFGPQGLSALIYHRGHSAERHAKACPFPPYTAAGIGFLFTNNDQGE